jgi:hypothetical protein
MTLRHLLTSYSGVDIEVTRRFNVARIDDDVDRRYSDGGERIRRSGVDNLSSMLQNIFLRHRR